MSYANVRGTLKDSIEQDIKHNDLLGDLDNQIDEVQTSLTTYVNSNLTNIRKDINVIRDSVISLYNDMTIVKNDIEDLKSLVSGGLTQDLVEDMVKVKQYITVLQQTYVIHDSNNVPFTVTFDE